MTTPATPEEWKIALQRCAEEQIQFIGQIQSDSVLIAVELTEDRFSYLSANAGDVLGGVSPDSKPSEIFGTQQLQALSKRVASWVGRGARLVEAVFPGIGGRPAWVHASGNHLVIEVDVRELGEDMTPASWDWEDSLRGSLNRVEACRDLYSKLEAVSEETWSVCGFDRVMIYRFLEDGTGEVVAERVRPDWEPYLGLRYPASDIPVQARQLFLKNDIRLIREVASVPVEILAVGDAGEAPLDLSLSRFRQPSPIHIEYLKNMGVDSSFVSAIVVDGALWGLISCHHGQPLNLPAKRQVQLAALTNHLASDLAGMAREVRLRNELACARVTSKLIQCITVTDDWTSVLLLMAGELCEILGADGMALQFDGNTFSYGVSAPSELIPRLINESIEQGSGLVHPFIRNPKAPEFQWLPEKIGGFLTLPLSHFRADALVFFRKETTRKVNWAGQPEKVVDRSDGVARLRPRQSFAIWQETVRGTCESWSVEDIAVAGSIKNTLSDIVITAHYFRQSYETPATARHRLAHEANPNPVVLADEIGIVVFQNQAAVSDPLLASLQSLDQLAARMPDLSEAFTSALYSLVHDEQEIRMQIAPDAAAPRWLEASLLTDDGRFVGYSIRLV